MSSRSIASPSSLLALLFVLLVGVSPASAGRRVVVLGFTGPKAAKFHDDVADAIRAAEHTVVDEADWKAAAAELGATELTDENVEKVARKLEVDGVVTGTVTKKRKLFKIHLTVRAGATGESVAEVDFAAQKPKVGPTGKKTLDAELLPALDELPLLKEPEPVVVPDEAGDVGGPDSDVIAHAPAATVAWDPRLPAAEVSVGVSVVARRLSFSNVAGAAPVQGYDGNPVAGASVSLDVYPLALSRTNRSFTRNLGVTASFDRVLKIESRLAYDDNGTPATAVLATTEQRWAAGLEYRAPIGAKLAVIGSVRYARMSFAIDRSEVPAGVTVQIPDVDYAFVEPGVAARYLAIPKLLVGVDVGVGVMLDAGGVANSDWYGKTSALPISAGVGAAYRLSHALVVGLSGQLTTVGLSFDGSGTLSNPNGDAVVDVPSGRDTYYGGALTVSYQH